MRSEPLILVNLQLRAVNSMRRDIVRRRTSFGLNNFAA